MYEQTTKLVNDKDLKIFLDNLKDRWNEEKMFEDFKDYETAIKNRVKKYNVEFIKATKSPFGFQIKEHNVKFNVSIKYAKNKFKLTAKTF